MGRLTAPDGYLLVVCQCGNGYAPLPITQVGTDLPEHCSACKPKRRGKDKNDRRTKRADRTATSGRRMSDRQAKNKVRLLASED